MSDAKEMKRRQKELEELAREFRPPQPKRYSALLPFRASIETLRAKGASYRRIANILRDHGVSISHDTVRLFCQECLEECPMQRRMIQQAGDRSVTSLPADHQTNGMTHELTADCQINDDNGDAKSSDRLTDAKTPDRPDDSQGDDEPVDAQLPELPSDRQTQTMSDQGLSGDASIGRKLAELRQKSDSTTKESSTQQPTGGPRIANPRDL
jgi:hypothetical protein